MSANQSKDFELEQERALEELKKTAFIREAVDIVHSPDKADEDRKQRDELKREYESASADVQKDHEEGVDKVDAVARLMGISGRLSFK